MRPSTPLFSAFLLLASCSTGPQPLETTAAPSPAEIARAALAQEVEAVSAKAEVLLKTQDELVWKSWTEGTPGDLAKTYAGTDAWLTPGAMASTDKLRQATVDAQKKLSLTHLHAYLVTEWLAQSTAGLSEEASALEQSMTFGPPGQEHPYRNLEALLASERSALLRKSYYEAATQDVTKLSAVLARRRARTEALLAELGLSSSAFLVELREAELDSLVALADAALTRTQDAFVSTLRRLSASELQLPLERVTRADIPRLFRLPAEDAAFPKADIYARATLTLLGLGVDVSTMKNVTVDLKETPSKNPRGLVLGVVIPSDVRLSLLPVGGARDERETLHQMGHVLADALSQEKRWALAKLGNRSLSEAWAFLLEDLSVDALWLQRVAGFTGEAQTTWRAAAGAQRLFLLRRAAGKVLFNAGARTPGAEVPALYRQVMTRTYAFPMTAADEARAELDREEFLASADYLEAFLLAAQLEAQLRLRFGPAWWESKAAGAFMRGLLAKGNSLTATGLAQSLGAKGIEVDAFVSRLPETLGWTPPAATPPDGGAPGAESRDAGPAAARAALPSPLDAGAAPAVPDATGL